MSRGSGGYWPKLMLTLQVSTSLLLGLVRVVVAVADEDSQNELSAQCLFSNIQGGSPSCSFSYLLPTTKPPKSIVPQPQRLKEGRGTQHAQCFELHSNSLVANTSRK